MTTKIAVIIFSIASIQNTLAQPAQVSTGKAVRIEKFRSAYVDARNVDIWLPKTYDGKKKHAVVYMHDGQMLFGSTNTWNKSEWRVDETLGSLMANKKINNCIVVGIWNNGDKRHEEYLPQEAVEDLPEHERKKLMLTDTTMPASDNYLKFIVHELKPYVDSAYNTYPDVKHTVIAGSSMGGLISLYAICEYPEIFGGAACISTHWPGRRPPYDETVFSDALLEYLERSLPSPKSHKIYFDHGTINTDSFYKPSQVKADAIMESKGYTKDNWLTREFHGEDHSERDWAERFHIPMIFLLGKN
jgi:predicted alpha/beta superfamily hydrolase